MRTLAIDLGARRIGLSLSDESGRYATPYEVIDAGSEDEALRRIDEVIVREGVRRLVVGLPLSMDGSVGGPARSAVAWGERLGARTGLPVLYVDERLSSFAADQSLLERRRLGQKLTRADRKKRLDAVAAARFLQDFLDGIVEGLPASRIGLRQDGFTSDGRGG